MIFRPKETALTMKKNIWCAPRPPKKPVPIQKVGPIPSFGGGPKGQSLRATLYDYHAMFSDKIQKIAVLSEQTPTHTHRRHKHCTQTPAPHTLHTNAHTPCTETHNSIPHNAEPHTETPPQTHQLHPAPHTPPPQPCTDTHTHHHHHAPPQPPPHHTTTRTVNDYQASCFTCWST